MNCKCEKCYGVIYAIAENGGNKTKKWLTPYFFLKKITFYLAR